MAYAMRFIGIPVGEGLAPEVLLAHRGAVQENLHSSGWLGQ